MGEQKYRRRFKLTKQHWYPLRPIGVGSCTGYTNRDFGSDLVQCFHLPILRNHPHLGQLIPRLQFHTAPIFLRCSSTLAASSSTSSTNFGKGAA